MIEQQRDYFLFSQRLRLEDCHSLITITIIIIIANQRGYCDEI